MKLGLPAQLVSQAQPDLLVRLVQVVLLGQPDRLVPPGLRAIPVPPAQLVFPVLPDQRVRPDLPETQAQPVLQAPLPYRRLMTGGQRLTWMGVMISGFTMMMGLILNLCLLKLLMARLGLA